MKWLFLSPLYLIIPLSVVSYLCIQRRIKREKIRNLETRSGLDIHNRDDEYRQEAGASRTIADYLIPVALATVMVAGGLYAAFGVTRAGDVGAMPFMLGHDFSRGAAEASDADAIDLSLIAVTWSFLGTYIFALQYIFRRYVTFDLYPRVYYNIAIRILYAVTIALVIRFLFEDFARQPVAPALYFIIGSFPDRGFTFIESRVADLTGLRSERGLNANNYPLSMIEGLSLLHRTRLKELGIDNVQNFAVADYVELIIRTPFDGATLISWILQAKLAVVFGRELGVLKRHHIDDVLDYREAYDELGAEGLADLLELDGRDLTIARRRIGQDDSIERMLVFKRRVYDADDMPVDEQAQIA